MSAKILKVVIPFATLLLVTGCIDNNYDLSNVDTTVAGKVNDLTIPINIDAITLSDIISLKDDDQIKEVTDVNGNTFYAFVETGEFTSDPIEIEDVKVAAPNIASASTPLDKSPYLGDFNIQSADSKVSYDFSKIERSFTYLTHAVDEAIGNIGSAEAEPLKFAIEFEIPNISQISSQTSLSNIKIRLMEGLSISSDVGNYDAETGIWTIDRFDFVGNKAAMNVLVSVFDFNAPGITFDPNTHTLDVTGNFTIESGSLITTPKNGENPDQITVNTHYNVDDMNITSFSGLLEYKLDGMEIEPVKLDNIPKYLSGDGTNIFLANPQIYLSLNNPVASDKLACSAELSLTAKRSNMQDLIYAAQSPIIIGYDHGVDGPYNYVLAPKTNASDLNIIDAAYSDNLTTISFPGLGNILGVPGSTDEGSLPDLIAIDLNEAQIEKTEVESFELGRTIEGVKGVYQIVAPLALNDNSQIIYTKTQDGWNDEDVDAIEITTLTITANVTNDTPLTAHLQAFPLNVNGYRISDVTISGADVEAGAVDAPITITMTGAISHLDGITYTATLTPGDNSVLTPDQTISLKNIKAKVSGSYTKEL